MEYSLNGGEFFKWSNKFRNTSRVNRVAKVKWSDKNKHPSWVGKRSDRRQVSCECSVTNSSDNSQPPQYCHTINTIQQFMVPLLLNGRIQLSSYESECKPCSSGVPLLPGLHRLVQAERGRFILSRILFWQSLNVTRSICNLSARLLALVRAWTWSHVLAVKRLWPLLNYWGE